MLAATGLAGPFAAAAPADDPVRELLDVSGAGRTIEQLPGAMVAEVAARMTTPAGAPAPRTIQTVRDSIRFEALARALHDDVKATASPQALQAALTMMRTPLALRMIELAARASAPDSQAELRSFTNELQYSGPPEERLALVQRLDRAMGASDLAVDLAVARFSAAVRGAEALRSGTVVRASDPALLQAGRALRAQAATEVQEQVLTELLFTYRAAKHAELAAYVEMLSTSAGRWMFGVVSRGVRTAVARVVDRMVADVARGTAERAASGRAPSR
jgi:hypothetical protein